MRCRTAFVFVVFVFVRRCCWERNPNKASGESDSRTPFIVVDDENEIPCVCLAGIRSRFLEEPYLLVVCSYFFCSSFCIRTGVSQMQRQASKALLSFASRAKFQPVNQGKKKPTKLIVRNSR